MPGWYATDEYDLAGFAVGVVERDRSIDGSSISVGDTLIGLASSGLHSNGYSLARKVLFDRMGLGIHDIIAETGRTVADELLVPTRIYVRSILNLLRDFSIHGIAHITGGGLPENVPRILPKGCMARIRTTAWDIPPIFRLLQQGGNIEHAELYRTFNCGIGMVLATPSVDAGDILQRLTALGETAMIIGEIRRCELGKEDVDLVG